jgi:hypothetical protein
MMLSALRRNILRCCALTVAPWFLVGAAETLPEQEERRSKFGLIGIVGRWSHEVSDGKQIVLADGPHGQSPSAQDAERLGTTLFGRLDPAFTANATSTGAFSLGVLEHVPQFTEGTYRAKFKLVSGASDQTAGLVFDLQPNGEYLFVRYNTKDGNVALWRYADGRRERVAETAHKPPLRLGSWNDIVLAVRGSRIVGTVNTDMRLEHDLQKPVTGRLGFWTKRDSVTMFSDIDVQPAK